MLTDDIPYNRAAGTASNLCDISWVAIDTEFISSSGECIDICAILLDPVDMDLMPEPEPIPWEEQKERKSRPLIIDTIIRPPGTDREVEGKIDSLNSSLSRVDNNFIPRTVSKYPNAPCFASIVAELLSLSSRTVFVAHNWKGAEQSIFRHEFKRLGFSADLLAVCTLEISKRIVHQSGTRYLGYSQDAIGELLSVPFTDKYGPRHYAKPDTKHLADIWPVLLKKAMDSNLGISTLGDLLWLQVEDPEVVKLLSGGESDGR